MRVLVSASSKHGATAEIAAHIGGVLRDRGFEVTIAEPEQVGTVEGYTAVVLGSAVYAGRWTTDAKALAARIADSRRLPPVWLLSSGPVGDPPKPDEEPADVAEIMEATRARQHRVFAGKLDKAGLSLGERAVMAVVRAPEGDFRDWDEISNWAGTIADTLEAGLETSPESE